MKLVKENISFERGRDPKTSMDIGVVKKYGPETRLFLEIQDYCKKNLEKNTGDYIIKVSDINYSGLEPIFTIEISKDYRDEELYTLYLTKDDGILLFLSDWSKNSTDIRIVSIDYLMNILRKKSLILESFNFERSKDPKKSMRVGLTSKYGEGLELFNILYNISEKSDNFEGVTDIILGEKNAEFQIESKFPHTLTRDPWGDMMRINEFFNVYVNNELGVFIETWDGRNIYLGTGTKSTGFDKLITIPEAIEKFSKVTRCFEE